MTIYLVKGYLDVAAVTLADAQALLTALANPALASNQAIIDKVTGKLETLVQSDSGEPLTISSIDDTAGSYSAWVTDAQTTLAVGLGLPNTSTLDTYASTTSFSITANTRTGTLALNSRELSNGLLRGGLRLQIRTTNSAGAAETRALLRINVVPGVLESPVGDRDVDYTSYVEVAALATAASASAAAATTAETNAETAETNAETAQAAAAISAAAALVSENAASASASTATTQAGTATTQAGTATTQAGIATTQAGLATTAKTAAETAETNAETAETNAAASATAAGISAAAALVSEAAALVSKNAAAASAATASAVSGSGNGTFSAAALTGVNSVTASASTALTLTGGSTGASLVLGQGANADATIAYKGTGKVAFNRWVAASATAPAALAASAGGIYFLTNGSVAGTQDSWVFDTGYTDQTYRFKVAGTDRMVIAANTGNLLIGTTTDAASLAGGLIVNGSNTGAAASSTTTGALRVTGGVGVSGAGYFGGTLVSTESATAIGFQHANAGSARFDAKSNGNSSAGFTSSNDNGATVWFAGARKDTVGGSSGTDRYNILLGTSNLFSLSTTGAATFAGAVTANGQLALSSDASALPRKLLIYDTTSGLNTQGIEFSNSTLGTTNSTAYIRAIRTSAGGSNTDLAFGVMSLGTVNQTLRLKDDFSATFAGAVTANGQLIAKGTATNDNAATGYIGEYVSASLASGSATALSNSTAKTVTSVSLTAGDWDVDALIGYVPSGATITVLYAGASSTNNTLGGEATYFQTPTSYTALSTSIQSVPPSQRFSLSATTTIYLIARADFSAGTVSAFGQIRARRVR